MQQLLEKMEDIAMGSRPNSQTKKTLVILANAEKKTPAKPKKDIKVNVHFKGLVAVTKPRPIRRPASQIGRNDICPYCDSGKKFKHCCWDKTS